MKILFLLIALIFLTMSGCETSVDSRVSDDESTRVLELYNSQGILGDQISSSESHKRPKQGLAAEASLIVVVN